ncbi:hypothetical protein FHS61_001510 [Altererythrobacter atlanticus]|uniref:Uncharacterized protein n=1 Tax=Croceibacterium atlanticum TaxID=1267766 RepID=A0A0F7KZC9_9SPHN|nr:hypothetical protein [Croceibacterium atlanticum]AKH44190.1 hypothetical protein WYH_03171 [Croceibacterium atlanticum]MBB5732501.1 hypothetical protein [Croceibacterium atlanticum]
MPSINPVRQGEVHAAIARASAATGVNFDYLLAQAKLESGFDPSARAGTSSAAGLYQFVNGTWLDTLDKHGAAHGLGWADNAISRKGGRAVIADPSMRAEVMALRYDPNASALMAAELARDNSAELEGFLGRSPDSSELYLAHFLGAKGARDFLGVLQATPSKSAPALFPKAAAANRPIFYDGNMPRTVGQVMDLVRAKVDGAMDANQGSFPMAAAYSQSLSASQGGAPAAPAPPPMNPAPARPSMAETLRATFGTAGSSADAAGQRVNAAYAKFKAFGL